MKNTVVKFGLVCWKLLVLSSCHLSAQRQTPICEKHVQKFIVPRDNALTKHLTSTYHKTNGYQSRNIT